MKQYGFTGKGTGKLGSAVFAISGGEQIVRQYNPVVRNPQTEAQVAQRAKFKLLTQLAAAMSGQIAFRKSGLTSARNKFVSFNSKNASFSSVAGDATEVNVSLDTIGLTSGSIKLPDISAQSDGAGHIIIQLSSNFSNIVSKVAYFRYKVSENEKLVFDQMQVINQQDGGDIFAAPFNSTSDKQLYFAYGIIEKSDKARTVFENYIADIASNKAILEYIKTLSTADYDLTSTSAITYIPA